MDPEVIAYFYRLLFENEDGTREWQAAHDALLALEEAQLDDYNEGDYDE